MRISRKKEIEYFWNLYSETDTTKPRVVNFYSPDSTILTDFFNDIRADVNGKSKHDCSVGFNFKNDTTSRDGYSVKMDFLYILSRQLILCRDSEEMFDYDNGSPILKRGFDKIISKWNKESLFSVFDTAFIKLEKLLGQGRDEDRADPAFEIALKIFGAVQNKDFEGVYTGIRSLFDKHESSADKKNRIEHKDILHKIEQYTNADALEEDLQIYFLHDAQRYLMKSKAPFIFLLDQLDSLPERDYREIQSLLLELIPVLPGTLWVIATSNKLDWYRTDLTLEHRLLGAHSLDEIKSMFEGIDDDVIDKVYILTQGTPIYTAECIDAFLDAKKKDNRPESQEGIKNEFFAKAHLWADNYLDHILMSMPQEQADILHMLTVYTEAGGWTEGNLKTTRKELRETDALKAVTDEMLVKDVLATVFPVVENDLGKYQLQAQFYDAASKHFSNTDGEAFLCTTPLRGHYLSHQAGEKLSSGNYVEAEPILREYAKLLELSPESPLMDVYLCQLFLGKCCIELDKLTEVEQVLGESFRRIIQSRISAQEKLDCVVLMVSCCMLPQEDIGTTVGPIPELKSFAADLFEYLYRNGKTLFRNASNDVASLSADEKSKYYATVVNALASAYNLCTFYALSDDPSLFDELCTLRVDAKILSDS